MYFLSFFVLLKLLELKMFNRSA